MNEPGPVATGAFATLRWRFGEGFGGPQTMTRLRQTFALFAGLVAASLAILAVTSCGAAQRTSSRPSAATVSAATMSAATASSSQPSSQPIVGLIAGTAQWSDASMADRLHQVISKSGAKWLREGFYWSRIEPSPGRFRFAHYDHFVLLAARHQEHVLAQLYDAPGWAAKTSISVPAHPAAYASYVSAVVGRYGPHGTFWRSHPQLAAYAIQTFELWNEPYYDNGNNGDYNPGRYANLVKAAATAGRAADPAVKFLIGAEMQGEFVGSSWAWWVDAMYRAVPNLNNYFDGVSVHPYGHDIAGLAPAIPGQAYYGYHQMRRIQLIRRQFVKHGAASKPFWATEVGWPTCTHGSDRCVSNAGQLASLRTFLRYSRTIWKSYVRAVFVYYFDDVGANQANPDNDYGLTYFNHRAKPALGVFRASAKLSPVTGWP